MTSNNIYTVNTEQHRTIAGTVQDNLCSMSREGITALNQFLIKEMYVCVCVCVCV